MGATGATGATGPSGGDFESSFGHIVALQAEGPFVGLGINGQNVAGFGGLDGRRLNNARSFSRIEASIDGEFPLPANQSLTVTLAISTNNGMFYTIVTQVTILGGTTSIVGNFGPTVFPAGSEHVLAAVLRGAEGAYNGPLKVSIS